MRRRCLALVVSATVTVAPLLVPPPATADDLVVLDGRSDYWHDHRGDGETPDQHRPDWGNPDLRRTAYRHWHDRVSVRFGMTRLVRRDGGYWKVEVRMRTNEGLRRTATWHKPFDSRPWVEWSGPGTCEIDGRIDFAEEVLVVEVPRTCLGQPSTVAFKSATSWAPTSDDNSYLDVSGESGYRLTEWSSPVARG